MAKKTTKPKAPSAEDIESIFDKRRQAERIEAKAKVAMGEAARLKAEVVKLVAALGVKSITDAKTNDHITYVQQTGVVYFDDLWDDLTQSQRREVFDEEVNLNELPSETRKALIKMIPKAERLACTTRKLNPDKVSTAVQNGIIDKAIVQKHSEIKSKAPYTLFTPGKGKKD